MKIKRTQKLEVVQSRNPGDFQDQINEIFERLGEEGIQYKEELFNNENGFSAYIRYERTERIPESIKDEYELRGIRPKCKDCEFYEPISQYEGRCFCVRGTLRWNDDVGNCSAFWDRMEEKDEGEMYDKLRAEIKAQYKTMYRFCEALGMNKTFFSNKLAGRNNFTGDDKIRILRQLGVEVNDENLFIYFN